MPDSRSERPFTFRGPEGLLLRGVTWEAAGHAMTPVVFSPGNGFCVQAYRPLLAELPPDVTIHGFNTRGHGGSEVPAGVENWDGMVADLRAYVEQHTQPPTLLAGHSMGAMVSLRLAAEAPALVAGLLLLEPPLRYRRGEAMPPEHVPARRTFIDRSRKRRAHWPSREEARAWFAGSVSFRLWADNARTGFIEAGLEDAPEGGVRLACPPEIEAAFYETVPQQELYAWADAARCPAVLFRGLDSPFVSAVVLEDLARALPVGVVLPVPGTHTFPMEHPREAGRLLAQGLRLLRGETGLAPTEAAPTSRG